LTSHTSTPEATLEQQMIRVRRTPRVPSPLQLPASTQATTIEMIFTPEKGPHSHVVAAYFPKPIAKSISDEMATFSVS